MYANGSHERRVEAYHGSGERFSPEDCAGGGFVYGAYNGADLTKRPAAVTSAPTPAAAAAAAAPAPPPPPAAAAASGAPKAAGSVPPPAAMCAVGGPLCFQGDFVCKGVALPRGVRERDFLVVRDAGANTLSLFSRHCCRLLPAVWGYRMAAAGAGAGGGGGVTLEVIQLREDVKGLLGFCGFSV